MPPTMQVFDPAMCCTSGVCGVDPDPELARIAADLEWLGRQGAQIERYNLGQEPEAFAASVAVRTALQREGVAVLPLVLVEGRIVSRGRYPTRAELVVLAGGLSHADAH
jgi:hypothetical protein